MDKEKILAGRKAINDYRAAHAKLHIEHPEGGVSAEHTPLLDTMLSRLKELGFNSLEELLAANEQLCRQEKERCYKVLSGCDGCKGRERGCIVKCYLERPKLESKDSLEIRWQDFWDWQHFEGHCPPNCSSPAIKVAEPEFDIYWGMPPGITPEQYQKMKQKEQQDSNRNPLY